MFTYYYGTNQPNQRIEVTTQVLQIFRKENVIQIPGSDHLRALVFSDPAVGVLKFFYVVKDNIVVYCADHMTTVYIDIYTNEIHDQTTVTERILKIYPNPHNKLQQIHNQMRFDFGNIRDEYPEQVLATQFLNGDETILELGANIGRNTLVMDHLTGKRNRVVTLECDETTAKQLEHNKNINNATFLIENSALSDTPVYQKIGDWATVKSYAPIEGYRRVHTITFSDLEVKYNIKFDTLVADCEGALYYILQEMPDMLQNINTIIIENDFNDIEHKKFVDAKFKEYGLKCVHFEEGGWGPCFPFFYEVWKRV